MTFVVRHKHKLVFKGSPNKYLGDVYSFNDSANFKVSSELLVETSTKYSEFPSHVNGVIFFLSAPSNKEQNGEVTKLYTFLTQHKGQRCMLVRFDSAGSTCLVGIPEQHETASLGSRCFKCIIVNHKLPMSSVPNTIVTTATTPTNETTTVVVTEQHIAASHYNDLKRDKNTRHLSQIYHVRNLNNFIKAELINLAAEKVTSRDRSGVTVIDFGCGMGGDIFKWFKNPRGLARYVGVDIAQNSLVQFSERLKATTNRHVDPRRVTHLVHADIGVESLRSSVLDVHTWTTNSNGQPVSVWSKQIPLPLALNGSQQQQSDSAQFDVASCQFAMHYMFQSAAKAHHFFEEVSGNLKPGGVFIATTIDVRVVSEMLGQLEYGAMQLTQPQSNGSSSQAKQLTNGSESSVGVDLFASIKAEYEREQSSRQRHGGKRLLEVRNDLGHVILTMSFAEDMCRRLIDSHSNHSQNGNSSAHHMNGNDEDSPYGIQYTFTLQDSSEESAVDAPEWIVPLGQPLRDLAEAHGLVVEETVNFQEMVRHLMQMDVHRDAKIEKMDQMKIFDYKGGMSEAEWSIARLYTAIIFRKKDNNGTSGVSTLYTPSSPDGPPPQRGMFAPSSPDGPPPPRGMFAPSSPDGPPPQRGMFAPSSPDGPPPMRGMFAPSSPDGPPPPRGMFAPSSPDGPPPTRGMFAPSSPDGPPPTRGMFAPSSPDGPPPPRGMFAPSSPEGPPPPRGMFAPSSPDGPPPPRGMFAPSSPDGPPPKRGMFAPSSPDGPPPMRGMFAPNSPEGPPPQRGMFAPGSPLGPPPAYYPSSPNYKFSSFTPSSPSDPPPGVNRHDDGESSDDEPDEGLMRLLAARAHAIALAGGEEIWDSLDDDQREVYTNKAERELSGAVSAGENRSSTPSATPHSASVFDSERGGGSSVDDNQYYYTAGSEEQEEDDEATRETLRMRDHAVLLAGGSEAWEHLSEDEMERYLAAAREAFSGGNVSYFPPSMAVERNFSDSPQEPPAPASGLEATPETDGFFGYSSFAAAVPDHEGGNSANGSANNSASKRFRKSIYDTDSDEEQRDRPVRKRAKTKYDTDSEGEDEKETEQGPGVGYGDMRATPPSSPHIHGSRDASQPFAAVSQSRPITAPTAAVAMNPAEKALHRVREHAIYMSRGQARWEALVDAQKQSMMQDAEMDLAQQDADDSW